MNETLLRHFQEFTEEERAYSEGASQPVAETMRPARKYMKAEKLIAIHKHARFRPVPEHTHEYVEMVYVCAGQITHFVNGNKIVQRAGELLLLNQYVRQAILPAGENDIAINFIILPQFFRKLLGMLGGEENHLHQFLLACLHNENQAGGFLYFQVGGVPQIQCLLESMLWTFVENDCNRRSINQYTMGLLFLYLLNHADKVQSGSQWDDLTFRILQYMEERYAEGTLTELAASLNYDMKWLSKSIKRLTGRTFRELQQSKRLAQTKLLLETTHMPVAEVAKQVGITNLTYFYRKFQEQVGCSPKAYRMQAAAGRSL